MQSTIPCAQNYAQTKEEHVLNSSFLSKRLKICWLLSRSEPLPVCLPHHRGQLAYHQDRTNQENPQYKSQLSCIILLSVKWKGNHGGHLWIQNLGYIKEIVQKLFPLCTLCPPGQMSIIMNGVSCKATHMNHILHLFPIKGMWCVWCRW
jgi:hypothetical protein